MPAPSYHLTSYTGTADPAGDIIALAEVDLTAAGWTFVEQASFTQAATARYIRVWKCPAEQNKAGVDFFIGLVKNQAPGVYLAARAFEGYNSTTHTVQRPCIAGSSTLIPWGFGWNSRTLTNAIAHLGMGTAGGMLLVGPNVAGLNVDSTTDGYTWTNRVMPSSAIWRGFAYGNGTWIAVSATSGTVAAYSTNGSTWLAAGALPSTGTWTYAAFGNGSLGNMFVAIPSNATSTAAASSPDGITWTARAMPVAGSWGPVRFGNGTFVALQRVAASTNVATSPDGQTWTNRPTALPAGSWIGLEFGGGVFCAISSTGLAATSTDGITWTSRATPNSYDLIAYGNGIFYALGGGTNTAGSSPDGVTWTPRTGNTQSVNGLAHVNGIFFACQSSSSAIIYATPGDPSTPYHGGAMDFPLDFSGANMTPQAELLPSTALLASTNYDVGVLASKSYLVVNVQLLGTTTLRLCWLLGLYEPIWTDSQASCPPLVAVDLRDTGAVSVGGVSRSPRVTISGNAFGALVGSESVPLGIFTGALAEPASGQIRACRIIMGSASGLNNWTDAGRSFRGRLYDAVAVGTGQSATAVKVGDSITIGSTVYTALGSSPNSQNFVTGSAGWFFDTAAGS